MQRDDTTNGRMSRRRVLKTTGAGAVALTLAGCNSGDGGSGGDGTGDGPGGTDGGGGGTPGGGQSSGGSEPSFCSELTSAGYVRYDEAESPFVGTFEYPTRAGDGDTIQATATVNNEHALTINKSIGDRQSFHMFPTQYLAGTDSLTAAERGEVSGLQQVGDLDFGGETVPIVRAAGGSNGDDKVERYAAYPYYVAGLPHEGSGGKTYYRFDFRATVQFADQLEPTVCLSTWEELARHVVESLEPNSDTTVESSGV